MNRGTFLESEENVTIIIKVSGYISTSAESFKVGSRAGLLSVKVERREAIESVARR